MVKRIVSVSTQKKYKGWNKDTASFLRWVGGKGGHYKKVLRPLFRKMIKASPGAPFYIPFLGGGGDVIELAKEYRDLVIHGNDLDPHLFNLWKIVEAGMVAGIFKHLPSDKAVTRRKVKALHRIHRRDPLGGDMFERAARFLVLNHTHLNGNMKAGFPRDISNFRYNRIELIKSLKQVQALLFGRFFVTCMDAKVFIATIPDGCPFYSDPPYVIAGPGCYVHSFNHNQHQEFATLLRPLKNWLLSYDNCKEVRALYSWARKKRKSFRYSNGKIKEKVELLIRPGIFRSR